MKLFVKRRRREEEENVGGRDEEKKRMIVDRRKVEKEKHQIERKRKKKFMTKIRGFFSYFRGLSIFSSFCSFFHIIAAWYLLESIPYDLLLAFSTIKSFLRQITLSDCAAQ